MAWLHRIQVGEMHEEKWLGPKANALFEVDTKWGKYSSILGHLPALSGCQGAQAEPARETKDRSWGMRIWGKKGSFMISLKLTGERSESVKLFFSESHRLWASNLYCEICRTGDAAGKEIATQLQDRRSCEGGLNFCIRICQKGSNGYKLQIECCTSCTVTLPKTSAGSCFFSSKWRGSPALWGHTFCSALRCGQFLKKRFMVVHFLSKKAAL